MAGGQDAAGGGGAGAPLRRVASLAEARAADPGALLVTAPGLAAFAGPGFWRAVEVELGRPVVVDCGDDAGLALGALRAGCRDLLFTGSGPAAASLADIAAQLGARLRAGLPGAGTGPPLGAFAAKGADVRSAAPEDDSKECPGCA